LARFKDSGRLDSMGLQRLAAIMSAWWHKARKRRAHLYDVVEKAGEAGTIAHDMIEAFILGKTHADNCRLGRCDCKGIKRLPTVRPSGTSNHVSKSSPPSARMYQSVTSSAATVDAIGRDMKGRVVLLDWKSSNAVYQDMLIQLAAYALLLEECASDWTPKGFHLLRVAKESADFAHHFFGELEDAKRSFVLMRELYAWISGLRKRAA